MIYNMLYDNGPKLPILITNQLDINTNSDILNFASYQKDHNQPWDLYLCYLYPWWLSRRVMGDGIVLSDKSAENDGFKWKGGLLPVSSSF